MKRGRITNKEFLYITLLCLVGYAGLMLFMYWYIDLAHSIMDRYGILTWKL